VVDWIFHILLGQAVAIGAVLALVGLLGVKPNGYLVLSFASIELALLVQLAVSVGIVLAGQQAAVSTVEFFGYLFVYNPKTALT
jgi:NADH:ubiquinone oxidoreductase subunit K